MNTSLLIKLSKMLLKLGSVKTDKGDLNYAEDELKEGVEVLIENENGEYVPAEDGDYTDENGNLIVIEGGLVKEIKPVEEPAEEPIEEPAEEPAEETTEEPTEEPAEETADEPTEEPVDEPTEEPAEEPKSNPELEEANKVIEDLQAKLVEAEARIAELEAELNKPLEEPVYMASVAQPSKMSIKDNPVLKYFNN